MAEDLQQWIYFIHPPRENFVETITEEEAALMGGPHSEYLQKLYDAGTLLLAGPTFGPGLNDEIAVIEAPDAAAAEAIMNADPAITSGVFTGELRPMHVAFLRSAWS